VPGDAQIFLKKHSDYQRAYAVARKGRSPLMGWFVARRDDIALPRDRDRKVAAGLRVGLTVPVALGKAVDRNRIKRRMRAAVRQQDSQLLAAACDVILHPRRGVLDCEFQKLVREIEKVLREAVRIAPARY
jgi:ribonuclease P protein component